jgi:hypothetical protein
MSTTSVYRVYDERDQLLYVNHGLPLGEGGALGADFGRDC